MTKPIFPLISISADGTLELLPEERLLYKVSALSLSEPRYFGQIILYGKKGNKWTYTLIAEKFKSSWLIKVLAKTIYNPIYNATINWECIGSYHISTLKSEINRCVDRDEDIITQFEEAEVITAAINDASTFEEIVEILNKYVFLIDGEN